MTGRWRSRRVIFARPFQLTGLVGVQPPGIYSVVTRENRHAGLLTFFKARTRSTLIQVCENSGRAGILQLVEINPLDLAAALTRDAVASEIGAPERLGAW